MKLALLFLLCLASVSYQQRVSPRFYPRSYYQPLLNLYSNQYANKEYQPVSYDDAVSIEYSIIRIILIDLSKSRITIEMKDWTRSIPIFRYRVVFHRARTE